MTQHTAKIEYLFEFPSGEPTFLGDRGLRQIKRLLDGYGGAVVLKARAVVSTEGDFFPVEIDEDGLPVVPTFTELGFPELELVDEDTLDEIVTDPEPVVSRRGRRTPTSQQLSDPVIDADPDEVVKR
jgi:hypothetical protein